MAEAQLAKKGGSYSLIGSIFHAPSGDKGISAELSMEINARLQAVLEDTLVKNITLKENVDTLGQEISRLSRENRQLSLVVKK
uniref:Uncharacterized protein n=1 Tax=Plectus sambesii TaxID=2011161 RepID=A0A914VGB0_9BILA